MNPRTMPRTTTFTPVPDPLLGPLLESIDDLSELKCILRALWHIHQKKGSLRYVTLKELAADPVLLGLMGKEAMERAMSQATGRGVFAKGMVGSSTDRTTLFVLNGEAERVALQRAIAGNFSIPEGPVEPSPGEETVGRQSNIFALYEQEIGMLTPFIADELKMAEEEYPLKLIEEAMRETARSGKRNWRYVSAILKRWKREGKVDGESGRYIKAADPKRYIEDYVQRRGELPRG